MIYDTLTYTPNGVRLDKHQTKKEAYFAYANTYSCFAILDTNLKTIKRSISKENLEFIIEKLNTKTNTKK